MSNFLKHPVLVLYNATEDKKTLDVTNQMNNRGLSLKKLSMLISTLKDVCLFVPKRMMETSILSIESHLHENYHHFLKSNRQKVVKPCFIKFPSISLLISTPKNTLNLQYTPNF